MSRWKRPVTRTYDYNFKLGENYYKPTLDYLEARKGRGSRVRDRLEDEAAGGSGAGELMSKGMGKFSSMNDLSLSGEKKSSLFSGGALDISARAVTPTSPRLIMGDRLLDSVGVQESKLAQRVGFSSSLVASNMDNKEESLSSASASRRRVQAIQSAQADLVSEDPFKERISSKLAAARKQADEMMEDMKRDSESTVSKFRLRSQAKKQDLMTRREMQHEFGLMDEDEETAAIRNKVNQIGERAKARLAQLEDDFPEIQIGSSLAARRAANRDTSFAIGFDDDEEDTSRMASKRTLKMTKRTVKASYEI